MRKALGLSPFLLAACAANAPVADRPASLQSPPIRGETPGQACRTEGTRQFIGQAGTAETGEAILRATHAAVLRWAPPGAMLTMDYREDRVTVRLGPDRKVTQIKCG
jgi:peptidase inhibitor I78 family protein